jgi:hypothetical protein
MPLTIELKGQEALAAIFNALPDKIQKKAIRPALRAGAKVIREVWREEIQRSLSNSDSPAPHLADTLHVKAMRRDRSKSGRIGYVVITGRRSELGIRDATDKEKAVFDRRRRIREQARKSARARGDRYVAPVFALKNVGPGYYPAHIEFGYVHGGRHIPGNPYGKRALESARGAAEAEVARVLSEKLRTASGLDGTGADVTDDAETFDGEVD